jgi:hypothetical protein
MPNWMYNPPMGVGQQGSVVQNANGGTPLVGARSIADARRMMQTGRAPQAQYPDGYLGTIIDRREDRVMVAVQGRLTQRQYQRGVHKGERIDLRDYFWPEWLTPDSGIENEATGRRWTPRGAAPAHLAHLGKNPVLSPADVWKTNPGKIDLPATGGIAPGPNRKRVAQLDHLRPPWS